MACPHMAHHHVTSRQTATFSGRQPPCPPAAWSTSRSHARGVPALLQRRAACVGRDLRVHRGGPAAGSTQHHASSSSGSTPCSRSSNSSTYRAPRRAVPPCAEDARAPCGYPREPGCGNWSRTKSSRDCRNSSSGANGGNRRALLLGGLAGITLMPALSGSNIGVRAAAHESGGVSVQLAPLEGALPPPPPGSLADRVFTAGNVTNPGNSLFSKPGVILYPKWMFGEWKVTSQLRDFRTPLGPECVDARLVQAARQELQQGEPLQYSLRFFSTLPDTLANKVKFNLGIMPNDAIAEDRAFNTTSLTNATADWEAVTSVAYDPTNSPDRETVEFSRLAPDMQPLPPRRAELYINNTRSESPAPSTFVTSQLYRQVMIGLRSVDTTDYEVMTAYEAFEGGLVRARQRTVLYLQPYDPSFFKAFGRAVAIYDHDLEMRRMAAPEDAPGAAACVQTPKDMVQCL